MQTFVRKTSQYLNIVNICTFIDHLLSKRARMLNCVRILRLKKKTTTTTNKIATVTVTKKKKHLPSERLRQLHTQA